MPTKRKKIYAQGTLPNKSSTKISHTREIALGTETELKSALTNSKRFRKKNDYTLSSILHPSLEILAESDTDVINNNNYQESKNKVDISVEAISFDIDLVRRNRSYTNTVVTRRKSNYIQRTNEQYTPPRGHSPYHRVRVQSPKRRTTTIVNFNTDNIVTKKSTIGINTFEVETDSEVDVIEENTMTLDRANLSRCLIGPSNSSEEMCRICHGGASMVSDFGPLVSACACRGTIGRVHVKCLEHWLTESGKTRCELCGSKYDTRRIHRYGIFKALIMWLFSQNSKQLIVDCLGIILMSPLAIFATWLSGKTLSGLMRKEDEVAPWPLTSTFVLACMTLVCYYCWIISAVTRHSLGWWTWYRSQYEVRLNTT